MRAVPLQAEEHFRATVETMLDPFIMMEAIRDNLPARAGTIQDFLITYANDAACKTAKRTIDGMVGQRLLAAMPNQASSGLFERYCQVIETGEPLILDGFEYEIEGGKHCRFLDIRAARLKDGLVLTWRDETERRLMETDLAEVQLRMVESIETERKKLASIIHDGPVQDLYAIDYQLHSLERGGLNENCLCTLDTVQGILHQVIGTLLNTVGELRPQTLAPFGLKAAILSSIHRFTELHPTLQIDLDLDEDRQTLAEPLRLGLFRIFQKLINNIERHACATSITIRLKISADQVLLCVVDNGVGFTAPERLVTFARSGLLGLASSFEQARRLGGKMVIDSRPGVGTRISVICSLKTPCQDTCPQVPGNGLNEGK